MLSMQKKIRLNQHTLINFKISSNLILILLIAAGFLGLANINKLKEFISNTNNEVLHEVIEIKDLVQNVNNLNFLINNLYTLEDKDAIYAGEKEIINEKNKIKNNLLDLIPYLGKAKVNNLKNNLDKMIANLKEVRLHTLNTLTVVKEKQELSRSLMQLRTELDELSKPLIKKNINLYSEHINKLTKAYRNNLQNNSKQFQVKQDIFVDAIDSVNQFIEVLNSYTEHNFTACKKSFNKMTSKLTKLNGLNINLSGNLKQSISNVYNSDVCQDLYSAYEEEFIRVPEYISELNTLINSITLIKKHSLSKLNNNINSSFDTLADKLPEILNKQITSVVSSQNFALQSKALLELLIASLQEIEIDKLSLAKSQITTDIEKLLTTLQKMQTELDLSEKDLASKLAAIANTFKILSAQNIIQVQQDYLQARALTDKAIATTKETTAEIITEINNLAKLSVAQHANSITNINTQSSFSKLLFVAVLLLSGVLSLTLMRTLTNRVERSEHKNSKLVALLDKNRQEKEEIIAVMKERLHNSISSIVHLSEDLQNSPHSKPELARLLQRSADEAMNSINAVEDYFLAKERSNTLFKQDFFLSELMQELCNKFEQLAEHKNLSFNAEFDLHDIVVLADRAKLKQIIANLLDNAIKYTEEGSVSIRASATTINNMVTFTCSIEDTGIGFTAKDSKNIFKAFYSKNKQSTGLGLTTCKTLLALMQGKLKVNSQPKVGTNFTVSLELALSSNLINKENQFLMLANANSKPEQAKILILEASEIETVIFKTKLAEENYTLEFLALSNTKVIHNLIKEQLTNYHAVILDLNNINLNKKTNSLIQKLIQPKHLLSIAILSSLINQNKIKALGFQAAYAKPLDFEGIKQAVQQHMLHYLHKNKAQQESNAMDTASSH